MTPKRAIIYSYGDDCRCDEIMKFIQEAGTLLDLRDIEKQPLTRLELVRLVGHLNLKHFINTLSPAYEKHDLGTASLSRDEVIDLIVEDHTLLKRPIIQSTRLVTIGCDKRKISDMLQLSNNHGYHDKMGETRGNRRPGAAASSGR